MEKHVELGCLLDYYGALLTERQRALLEQHVSEDRWLKLRNARASPGRACGMRSNAGKSSFTSWSTSLAL